MSKKQVDCAEVRMAGQKILIIDDNQDFVRLLEVNLSKRGYQVVTAANGAEGLKKVETEKPQLILLDIKMPEMDGFTFVRLLKKDEKIQKIPVVVLTGYEPMRDMFRFEGVEDYFLKTDDTKDLLKAIEKILQ